MVSWSWSRRSSVWLPISSPKPLPAAIHHLEVIEANTVVARPGWPVTDNDPKSVVFVHVQRDKGAVPMWSWRGPRSGRLNDSTHCVEAGPPMPGHKPSFEVNSHAATAGTPRGAVRCRFSLVCSRERGFDCGVDRGLGLIVLSHLPGSVRGHAQSHQRRLRSRMVGAP